MLHLCFIFGHFFLQLLTHSVTVYNRYLLLVTFLGRIVVCDKFTHIILLAIGTGYQFPENQGIRLKRGEKGVALSKNLLGFLKLVVTFCAPTVVGIFIARSDDGSIMRS